MSNVECSSLIINTFSCWCHTKIEYCWLAAVDSNALNNAWMISNPKGRKRDKIKSESFFHFFNELTILPKTGNLNVIFAR